jgi:hypothetical protein
MPHCGIFFLTLPPGDVINKSHLYLHNFLPPKLGWSIAMPAINHPFLDRDDGAPTTGEGPRRYRKNQKNSETIQ